MSLMIVHKDDVKDEKKYKVSDSFDFSAVTEPFQKLVDTAMAKMKSSGKRPIELIEDYLNTKVKNDPLLVKQLLRIYFSAYTNEPINAGLLAPSSEGKTYATVEVAEIFPKEDVISIGRMSPTALIHAHGVLVDGNGDPLKERLEKLRLDIFNAEADKDKKSAIELKQIMIDMIETARTEVDLTHKILLFLDNPKPETYETLKPIMSHDKKEIIYRTTKSDGSLKVKETVIKGWPAVIVCSAKNEAQNEVWAEIVTREVILSPNTDITKYHAANKLTSQKMGLPSMFTINNDEKNIIKFYVEQLCSLLKRLSVDGNNAVFNLFAEKMADLFPHNEGITMRHFKRLMSFVNIETLINAHSNMKIEYKHYGKKEKQIFIITSLKSIKDGINILGDISTVPPEKIKFYNEIFVPLIKEEYSIQETIGDDDQQQILQQTQFKLDTDSQTLTANNIAEKYIKVFHKPITPKQIQENYLKPLTDEGILDYSLNPNNKKQFLYFISSKLSVNNIQEINRQLKDSVDNHFAYIWSCLVRPFQLSTKSGIMLRIFDSQNERINYKEFKIKLLLLNNNNNLNNNNFDNITKSIDNQGEKND